MKRWILVGTFVVAAAAICSVAADSKSNPCPPRVVFFGLGAAAPQTPEQFDEAAREYVAAKKISFSLEDAGKKVVVHISGTNAPIWVEYWHGLHYLKVQFDRNGKPLGHRQGINYVR